MNSRDPPKLAGRSMRAYARATRPHFIFAYLVFALGGLVCGRIQGLGDIDLGILSISLTTLLVGAIGVHFRDEASDWDNGFDLETGGAGVIREGLLTSRRLGELGIYFTVLTYLLMVFQCILSPALLVVGIPVFVVLAWPNYLTERVFLGHEAVTAFSFMATSLWFYLGQGWALTPTAYMFSTFEFLVAFAVIPYQDIGDYESDKDTGKKTLVVRLGLDAVGHLSIFIGLLSLFFLYGALLALP